jgi:HEAT repeat protein
MQERNTMKALSAVGGCLLLLLTARAGLGQTQREEAWTVLRAGASDKSNDQRVAAMRVLTLISGDAQAVRLAERALQDETPEVRAAAAITLGTLKSKTSIPRLTALLKDTDSEVVLSAASALASMGNESGFEVYYALVTGQRKSGAGLVAGEETQLNQVLSNPKDLASTAFVQGIGFVPFGGLGYGVFKAFHDRGEKEAVVKAAAVKELAKDPDPRSAKALIAAAADQAWVIRASAYDALARRGDRSLVGDVAKGLKDENYIAKLAAAAAVAQLSSLAP